MPWLSSCSAFKRWIKYIKFSITLNDMMTTRRTKTSMRIRNKHCFITATSPIRSPQTLEYGKAALFLLFSSLPSLTTPCSPHTRRLTSYARGFGLWDDVCLLLHKLSGMQEKINNLVELARTVGIEINIAKTKVMRVNHFSRSNIKIDNHKIDFVDSFCYLRSIITTDGRAEKCNYALSLMIK